MKRNNHVKPSRFPAAVDLGNSSFRVLIADFLEDGSLNLLGIGEAPARGIREGKIDDIEEAAQALAAAIKEAEIMSGLRVERVLVGITGDHLHGRNVRESVIISDNTVTVSDIDNVRRLASVTVTEPHKPNESPPWNSPTKLTDRKTSANRCPWRGGGSARCCTSSWRASSPWKTSRSASSAPASSPTSTSSSSTLRRRKRC